MLHRGLILGMLLTFVPLTSAEPSPTTTPADVATQPAPRIRVAWRAALPKPADAPISADSTLALWGDSSGHLFAFDMASGNKLWQVELSSAITSSAAIATDAVFIGDESGQLTALSRSDGKTLWSIDSAGKIIGRPLVTPDRVLFGSYDQCVYALERSTGKELWKFETAAQVHAGLALAGEIVLAGGCDANLRAISISDGSLKWSSEVDGPLAASAVRSGDRIFAATMPGTIYAFDAATGKELWTAKPDAGQITHTPILLKQNVLFATDDGQILAYSQSDGAPQAKLELSGKLALALYGPFVAVGTEDGKVLLLSLDASEFHILQKATLGGSIISLSTPALDALLAGTDQGTLWRLSPVH